MGWWISNGLYFFRTIAMTHLFIQLTLLVLMNKISTKADWHWHHSNKNFNNVSFCFSTAVDSKEAKHEIYFSLAAQTFNAPFDAQTIKQRNFLNAFFSLVFIFQLGLLCLVFIWSLIFLNKVCDLPWTWTQESVNFMMISRKMYFCQKKSSLCLCKVYLSVKHFHRRMLWQQLIKHQSAHKMLSIFFSSIIYYKNIFMLHCYLYSIENNSIIKEWERNSLLSCCFKFNYFERFYAFFVCSY